MSKMKNPLQIFNVAMFVGVLGLTYYTTAIVPQQQENQKVTVYVAKENINANVDLETDMFIPTQVSKGSVLTKSYVTDLETLNKSYSNSMILKDEPLMVSRITDSAITEGNYEIKLEPNFSGKLEKNDNIQVFVQLVNKDTGSSSIYSLFDTKKVHSLEYIDASVSSVAGVYVKVNEDELKDYYTAKQKGNIIISKITGDNYQSVEKIDFESEEFKNAVEVVDPAIENPNAQETTQLMVGAGDTLESIAANYNMSVEDLKALNLGVEVLTEGQMLNVPNK